MNIPTTQDAAMLARARRLLHDHRTRAKRDGAELNYSLHDLRQLLTTSPTCAYCRAPVVFDAQLDHKTPIARGGRHVLDNLAVCCGRCNSIKGMLTETEFDEVIGVLALLPPVARTDIERRLIAGGRRYSTGRRGG